MFTLLTPLYSRNIFM